MGVSGGFEVHEAALEAFAATSRQRQSQFEECLVTATQLTVGRDAFGHIPGIGARLYQAYENHVEECHKGISSAASAMTMTSDGLKTSVKEYQTADTATENSVLAIQWEIVDVTLEEPS